MFASLAKIFAKRPATQAVDLILLDDEPYVIKVWQTFAEEKGKKLLAFDDPQDLLKQISPHGRETPVFVDVQLKAELNGIEVAQKLVKMGFKSVYFTTSHAEAGLSKVTGIKGTIDKRFPSWIG